MKKDRLWSLFLIAAVIFMIVCGCRLIQIVLRYQEADSLYDDIEKEVFVPDILAEDGKNQKEENDTGVKPAVDFQKLISINGDVVGWISIPELGLEYPITQGEDNEYYLHHAYNREASFAGSIFMDYRNEDFQDQNTILYGHNMLNGSMFGSLKHLDVNTRPKVIIYTQEAALEYEVVENKVIGVSEGKYYQTSFLWDEFLPFLQEFCPEISGAESEKILTLSTCNGNSAQRRIVSCRLIKH